MTHNGFSIASLMAVIGTLLLHWSPYLQVMATVVAIIAGSISIYKSIKKK